MYKHILKGWSCRIGRTYDRLLHNAVNTHLPLATKRVICKNLVKKFRSFHRDFGSMFNPCWESSVLKHCVNIMQAVLLGIRLGTVHLCKILWPYCISFSFTDYFLVRSWYVNGEITQTSAIQADFLLQLVKLTGVTDDCIIFTANQGYYYWNDLLGHVHTTLFFIQSFNDGQDPQQAKQLHVAKLCPALDSQQAEKCRTFKFHVV